LFFKLGFEIFAEEETKVQRLLRQGIEELRNEGIEKESVLKKKISELEVENTFFENEIRSLRKNHKIVKQIFVEKNATNLEIYFSNFLYQRKSLSHSTPPRRNLNWLRKGTNVIFSKVTSTRKRLCIHK